MTFDHYSRYYDLLYADKDYAAEADAVQGLLQRFSHRPVRTILELGCGTGRHAAALARRGYRLIGLDRSVSMIAMARDSARTLSGVRTLPCFVAGDCTAVPLRGRFDAVCALFHVLSYLTGNATVLQTFSNVRAHLEPGGVFLFDCWYGPGVLSDPPAEREKRATGAGFSLYRRAVPELHPGENTVDVHYDVAVTDMRTGATERFQELHCMRYFFLPELELMLGQAGLSLLAALAWPGLDTLPGLESWYAMIAAGHSPGT